MALYTKSSVLGYLATVEAIRARTDSGAFQNRRSFVQLFSIWFLVLGSYGLVCFMHPTTGRNGWIQRSDDEMTNKNSLSPFGGVAALQSQCLSLAAVACESQYVVALDM